MTPTIQRLLTNFTQLTEGTRSHKTPDLSTEEIALCMSIDQALDEMAKQIGERVQSGIRDLQDYA